MKDMCINCRYYEPKPPMRKVVRSHDPTGVCKRPRIATKHASPTHETNWCDKHQRTSSVVVKDKEIVSGSGTDREHSQVGNAGYLLPNEPRVGMAGIEDKNGPLHISAEIPTSISGSSYEAFNHSLASLLGLGQQPRPMPSSGRKPDVPLTPEEILRRENTGRD